MGSVYWGSREKRENMLSMRREMREKENCKREKEKVVDNKGTEGWGRIGVGNGKQKSVERVGVGEESKRVEPQGVMVEESGGTMGMMLRGGGWGVGNSRGQGCEA